MAWRVYLKRDHAITEEIRKPLQSQQFDGEEPPNWIVDRMAENLIEQTLEGMWWCSQDFESTEFWETFEFFWEEEED